MKNKRRMRESGNADKRVKRYSQSLDKQPLLPDSENKVK